MHCAICTQMKCLRSAPGCGPNSGCPPQVIDPFLEEEVEALKPHFPRAPDESEGAYCVRILEIIERSDRMVDEYEYGAYNAPIYLSQLGSSQTDCLPSPHPVEKEVRKVTSRYFTESCWLGTMW